MVRIADALRAARKYGPAMTTIVPSSQLAALEAGAVMSPGLVSCPPCAGLTEVATLMAVHQVHAVVVDPGAPRLITARDVVRAALAGATSADEVIAPQAPSVAPDDALLLAGQRMIDANEGHVVVREHGDGRASGIVSSFDIAAVLAGHEPRVARIVRPAPARPAMSSGRLDTHVVRDVMHRGIVSCAPTAPLAEVASALVEHRTHTVIVSREGGMAFVTDMELVAAAVRGGPAPTAGEMASSGLAVIRADATLDLAASLVAETAAGHVVAVDAEGFPVGVVSTLDLVGAIAVG
jgi:CBS domain-containing protein